MPGEQQQEDEERFSVNPEEQKAMTLLGHVLKMRREVKAYDLQNLPFDPAIEAMKAAESMKADDED
jgi:hypothetical protein